FSLHDRDYLTPGSGSIAEKLTHHLRSSGFAFGQEHQDPQVNVQVGDSGFFRRVFFGGDVALGESFMDGAWDTENLTEFMRLLILNREALEGKQSVASKALGIFNRWRHLARANTLLGSRRNIGRHYDLSKELFAAFLDDSMTYSCA
ncbi:class I SAM-dependent methyltransferase, partial [Desulfosoma sp.]